MLIMGDDKKRSCGLRDTISGFDLGQVSYFLGLKFKSLVGLIVCIHGSMLIIFFSSQICPILNLVILHFLGRLHYLTMTRLDMSHALQIVRELTSDTHQSHLTAVHCILRYLHSAPFKGLFFSSSSSISLRAYAGADRAGCPDTQI